MTLAAQAGAQSEVTITSDITRLGVGARPLGMGRAFAGLADDISAMYLNPGGLGGLKSVEFLSMSASFANTANYLTLCSVAPTKFGTFGIGYSGTGFGFNSPVLIITEIATGEYRIIPSTTESVSYNYNNYVIALAYGTTLFRPELTLGGTFKLFKEDISGTSSANSNGNDLDLGVLYRYNPVLSFGAMARNLLPVSLGGKVTWNTGQISSLPVSYVLGANIHFNLLNRFGYVNISNDYEYKPSQSAYPGYLHSGVEWWPNKLLALRAGLDQDVIGIGSGLELQAANNLTAGLSLNFSGARFDYAFHKYNNISANDTHYFSFAYAYEPVKFIPLALSSPADKLITTQGHVTVAGLAKDTRTVEIKLNNHLIGYNRKSGSFEAEIELPIGKNSLWVGSYDSKGKLLDRQRVRVLRLASFKDIGNEFWAKNEIEQLATLGILTGFPDNTFQPDQTLKRAHFLIKFMEIGSVPTAESTVTIFKDVRKTQPMASFIKGGYDRKLVKGYPDKTFKPSQKTNLLEAIVVTVRYSNFGTPEVLERPFADIDARHWGIMEITAAKQNRMLDFAKDNLNPKEDFTRAEFAALISRVPALRAKIDALLDFEQGYGTTPAD
ncbi:MAG: S-layer homology domain-containing protein [Candidatus Margulisiibacteriota bacterium]